MKWRLSAIVLAGGIISAGVYFVGEARSVTVVKSSAQAWVWVAPDQHKLFVDELDDYAKKKGLRVNTRKLPVASWEMMEVTLLTPKDNKISVANATAPGKFSAAIMVLHPEENWRTYWTEFRAYVSARHRWEDVP